jgi:hypothetical protein
MRDIMASLKSTLAMAATGLALVSGAARAQETPKTMTELIINQGVEEHLDKVCATTESDLKGECYYHAWPRAVKTVMQDSCGVSDETLTATRTKKGWNFKGLNVAFLNAADCAADAMVKVGNKDLSNEIYEIGMQYRARAAEARQHDAKAFEKLWVERGLKSAAFAVK